MKLLINLCFSLFVYILVLMGVGFSISLAFSFVWFMASDTFLFVWEFPLMPKLFCSLGSLFVANYVIMDYIDCKCDGSKTGEQDSS